MKALNLTIATLLAVLLALLAISPFQAAVSQGKIWLRVGLVGKLSSLNVLLEQGVISNLIMSMVSDSLYTYSNRDKMISPLLAEGWPNFSQDGKSVSVKLGKGVDPQNTGLFSLQSIAAILEASIPEGYKIVVQPDLPANSLVFRFENDSMMFWDIFAFKPIFSSSTDGVIEGAGSPSYRIGGFQVAELSLLPVSEGIAPVSLIGYKDQMSMIQAFSDNAIDYCMTDLNRTSAQLKGQNWQSASEVALALVVNSKSSVFGSSSTRSAALSMVDRPYLVLRTIQGRAIQSNGLYFTQSPENRAALRLDGMKIRLLSASGRLDSLEMLCSMMIKSWWEKAGASVSINLPSDKPDSKTRMQAGDFDAIVKSVWLRPGFASLLEMIGDGGVMQVPVDSQLKLQIESVRISKSFDEMKAAAAAIEADLLKKYLLLPLIYPVRTELYRPDRFQGWNSVLDEPLISSYRDFAGISVVVP